MGVSPRPDKPVSPLWKCANGHFGEFLADDGARYQAEYGFLRPAIPEAVNRFLTLRGFDIWLRAQRL